MTANREAIRQLFRVDTDRTNNQPFLPAIFPDQLAPVVRIARGGERVMQAMRWGVPAPQGLGNRPVTNVRNTESPFWRGWLKPEFRCLVPATSFCEYSAERPKVAHWFALRCDRQPFAFAGLWRPWTGMRNGESGQHLLFAFLTTEPNAVVKPVHPKSMPVILAGGDCERWLAADLPTALALQRPWPDHSLAVVARGAREDLGADPARREHAV
jgi:putative SOS response-associated peptidase YedK